MNAKDLAAELDAGFQSAADAMFDSREWKTAILGQAKYLGMIRAMLTACANNAAQGLSDRTISGEEADVLATFGQTVDDVLEYAKTGVPK